MRRPADSVRNIGMTSFCRSLARIGPTLSGNGRTAAEGIRVFYTDTSRQSYGERDRYVHLSDVYAKSARYCVIFVSRHYVRKVWTKHQRRSLRSERFRKIENTFCRSASMKHRCPVSEKIIGYLDLKGMKATELARSTSRKLGTLQRSKELPPKPDLLFRS